MNRLGSNYEVVHTRIVQRDCVHPLEPTVVQNFAGKHAAILHPSPDGDCIRCCAGRGHRASRAFVKQSFLALDQRHLEALNHRHETEVLNVVEIVVGHRARRSYKLHLELVGTLREKLNLALRLRGVFLLLLLCLRQEPDDLARSEDERDVFPVRKVFLAPENLGDHRLEVDQRALHRAWGDALD